jgi:hypothetical protein
MDERKYDEANGGIKAGDAVPDEVLRETRVGLEKRDGIHSPAPQRNAGETDSAYQNRLRDEIEKLKRNQQSERPAPSAAPVGVRESIVREVCTAFDDEYCKHDDPLIGVVRARKAMAALAAAQDHPAERSKP